MRIVIREDDLTGIESQSIVREHMAGMLENTPIESVHALPLDKLRQAHVTFWTAWVGVELCGCGALQTLDQYHAEVKSMRTREKFLRQGVGQAVLSHIVTEARSRGLKRLSLETGSAGSFAAARTMYLKNGFKVCSPFGDYKLDPLSVFMTKHLESCSQDPFTNDPS
jgi:putative acetyltransferase